MKDSPPGRPNWAQSRLIRLTQGGPKGAQASIIGFVLAGPIIGGFLLGYWLDQKFGTQFWTIILGLLGVFSGFREMFTLLKHLAPMPGRKTPPPGREQTTLKISSMSPVQQSAAQTLEESAPKPRLFSVPPPPLPGQQAKPADELAAPETTEEVIKRLLGQDEDEDNGAARDERKNE